MTSPQSAATDFKKSKKTIDVDDLAKLFDVDPVDYQTAWNDLKRRVAELDGNIRMVVPPASFSQELPY